jgi:FkbM family methyltransferase
MINDLVYDIGMNDGDDTAYYLSLGHKVIAVEANPLLAAKAEKRFREYIEKGKLQVLNIGIAGFEGEMDFYVNKYDSGWSSFHLNLAARGGRGYETIKVKTKTLGRLISESGTPLYVKIDIEGNDQVALDSLVLCPEKPEYISIELVSKLGISSLASLGYNKFKLIDQQSLLPLEAPPLREYVAYEKLVAFKTSAHFGTKVLRKLIGKPVTRALEKRSKALFHYDHPFGSSGPFGKELPGSWHSLEEMVEIFVSYKAQFGASSFGQENGWWVDLHASY